MKRNHRRLLRPGMVKHGSRPVAEDWRRFTPAGEPYMETRFGDPVR